ncbi:uncharacterized protein LOC130893161 [Diorhabda carinulata]|uniref:uncharacterized protein LOC130445112 n=1 Tax=Diorhabda sublineata TaxID=1163346 RepID=UPI0024E12932|nr:uncharacterized protein LOC130445112 [Diorhabda sublineata]XP_057655024.1 uncharacterized protein LOC130893161 [Diorhabda carinulata]
MSVPPNKSKPSHKAAIKWSPSTPIRKQDNIISSKAREKNLLGFKPSYEVENEPVNMKFLMSNEYMRMWFKQRAVFEKYTYTREEIIKSESKIHRKFVQRMMTYRKPGKNELVEQKFMEKKLTPEQSKDLEYQKLKFKPDCSTISTTKVRKNKRNVNRQGENKDCVPCCECKSN